MAAPEIATNATAILIVKNVRIAKTAPDAIRTVMTALQKKYNTAADVTDLQYVTL
jgi:hypothetical protein